jgi:hypothetical protein
VRVQYLEKFDQGDRSNRLAGFITRKGIDAAAENGSRLFLIQFQLFPNIADKRRGNGFSIDLFVKGKHGLAYAPRLRIGEDELIATGAMFASGLLNDSGTAFVSIGNIHSLFYQFRLFTIRAFHDYNSLKDKITTPSLIVSFKYTFPAVVSGWYTSCQER